VATRSVPVSNIHDADLLLRQIVSHIEISSVLCQCSSVVLNPCGKFDLDNLGKKSRALSGTPSQSCGVLVAMWDSNLCCKFDLDRLM